MLDGISWPSFMKFVITCLVIYYLWIWIFLFKAGIPSLEKIRSVSLRKKNSGELSEMVQHISEELKPEFIKGRNGKELINSLQNYLKKYNATDDPSFRRLVNEFIVHNSEKICGIRFSKEDLRVLWMKPDEQP